MSQAGQPVERMQSFRDDVLMRRKIVIRQGFPVGEGQNLAGLIEEERQKRLSRIDGEADAVEERLLEIEAQREARARAAAEAQERLSDQDAEANRATSDLARPLGADETPPAQPE